MNRSAKKIENNTSSLGFLFDDSELWVDGEDVEQQQFHTLNTDEKERIKTKLVEIKENISSIWFEDGKMKGFYKKYDISSKEAHEYIGYFLGEKVLSRIISQIEGEKEIEEMCACISTKFLSFIRDKKLGVDGLLKMVIALKNRVIECFFDENIAVIKQIAHVFDNISTEISKNYTDTIVKLLNEYANAIDNSTIISKTDINGYITSVNDEFCRLSEYTPKELIGQPHNIVRHPDMPKEVFKDMWETIKSKKIWKGDVKNRTKSGGSYWVKATVVPILDSHNQIVEYISIRTDITELKEAHKNLEEYTEVLNETNMVLKLDRDGKIISANDIFLRMSGYSQKELLGNTYIKGLSGINGEEDYEEENKIPHLGKHEIKEIESCMKSHITWKGLIKNKKKTGKLFWTSTHIVPIINLNDDILEYIIVQSDVTDLETAQQKLKASLASLKELDTKKDDFLNIASHELRTPMTSIKGYISMILEGDAGEINNEVRLYLSQVYKGSQRLLDLINDMLDVSKIESGKEKFDITPVNISRLIQETESETRGLFAKKEQEFIVSIDNNEDFLYSTDENKLKQVLFNLLGNANKFTPKGGVVRMDYIKKDGEIIINITDSGIGIKKADFEKIFEKFGQVKNSLTRDIDGTGLGLPIVKAIVEQMHGQIKVSSELGKGSTFSIHLPIH